MEMKLKMQQLFLFLLLHTQWSWQYIDQCNVMCRNFYLKCLYTLRKIEGEQILVLPCRRPLRIIHNAKIHHLLKERSLSRIVVRSKLAEPWSHKVTKGGHQAPAPHSPVKGISFPTYLLSKSLILSTLHKQWDGGCVYWRQCLCNLAVSVKAGWDDLTERQTGVTSKTGWSITATLQGVVRVGMTYDQVIEPRWGEMDLKLSGGGAVKRNWTGGGGG